MLPLSGNTLLLSRNIADAAAIAKFHYFTHVLFFHLYIMLHFSTLLQNSPVHFQTLAQIFSSIYNESMMFKSPQKQDQAARGLADLPAQTYRRRAVGTGEDSWHIYYTGRHVLQATGNGFSSAY